MIFCVDCPYLYDCEGNDYCPFLDDDEDDEDDEDDYQLTIQKITIGGFLYPPIVKFIHIQYYLSI